MLVTFSSDSYSNISMFGSVAERLLKLMGNSGTIPGALLADDVPIALRKLQSGLDGGAGTEETHHGLAVETQDQDEPDSVSLHKRALPLIALLDAASKAHANVMWK